MQFLGFLLPVLSLVSLVAFGWLVWLAFKRSAPWGLVVLLLSPIAAIVFAVKHWEESKKPFLIYLGSGMVAVLAIFGTVATFGYRAARMVDQFEKGEIGNKEVAGFMEEAVDDLERAGAFEDTDPAELERIRHGLRELGAETEAETDDSIWTRDETETAAVRPALRVVPEPSLPIPAWDPATPPGYHAIRFDDADDFIGRKAIVVAKNGREHRGLLARVTGRGLQLERYLTAGTISFEVGRNEIASVQVSYR